MAGLTSTSFDSDRTAGRRLALEQFDQPRVFEQVKAEYARLLELKGLQPPRLG
jgi:hypothetical protein